MALSNSRIKIAALALSASAFAGLIASEGWSPVAYVPVKNDRLTVGFGSTLRDDGSPVRMGDTITPQKAITRTLNHIGKDEAMIKRCVIAPLSQTEYDLMVDFSYQYGNAALCKSSIVTRANAGDYVGSCESYLKYRFSGGYDCSTPGNRVCAGVWTRQLKRHAQCMEAQS